jgi:hypothetical protein
MAVLKTNLTTASTDVTPTVPKVREGEPDELTQDTIAFWASGMRQSRTGGNTLTKVNIERGVEIMWYLRGAIRAGQIDSDLERRLIAVEEAILTRVLGDFELGGNAIGVFIDDSEYGWVTLGSQVARTGRTTAWIDLPEIATLSA